MRRDVIDVREKKNAKNGAIFISQVGVGQRSRVLTLYEIMDTYIDIFRTPGRETRSLSVHRTIGVLH